MWGMEIRRAPCSRNPQILSVDVKKADSDLDLDEGTDDGAVVRISLCGEAKTLILDMWIVRCLQSNN